MRIGICAPATPLSHEQAGEVWSLAKQYYPDADLVFDPQCFEEDGHFAGSDADRKAAFVRMANDPTLEAIWFAKGGYGSCRIAQAAVAELGDAAKTKQYLGYSDMGYLLGALYRAGIGHVTHGPMPTDISREGGSAAVGRALAWLVRRDASALAPSLQAGQRYACFNLITLVMMTGTPLMPDLSGHVLILEETGEYLYAIDRLFFHVTSVLKDAGLTGIALGEVTAVPENDRPFGATAEEIAQDWCGRAGIPYLGRAEVGHSITNHVVPFGLFQPPKA
ncbi:LD-carboxypeptidase [Novosphingopyxis iocasae]|uniref:LD-carboxypeptidase n=1 Tax=Novosphingopyxis iocasae TaxID=2762729 RepID=UPI0016514E9C|nr:LD-carboxypeptidase [Novosphingopyxis iocasae]